MSRAVAENFLWITHLADLDVPRPASGGRSPRGSLRHSDGAEFAEHLDPLLIPGVPPAGVRRLSRNIADQGLIQNMKGYPKAVFFILGNEFCERFSFYGMKAILMLYFVSEHGFQEHIATMIYHAFTCIAYLTPLLGSVIADSFFGRFKVILYVSMIYVLGHVMLSFGAIPSLGYGIRSFFDFGGLLVIALGTGGIKPCVSAFAADQFDESQAALRAQFFSFFYFAINAGSLFAILLTPILRGRVQCFGSQYCFPLAFGVPGVLMAMALVLFLFGWRFYKKVPPQKENLVGSVTRCIGTAVTEKTSSLLSRDKNKEQHEHWLDYASPAHSRELIEAVKGLLSIACLYGPLVFFWALFDQQGSTWVLQARRLDGRIGPITILPEQMNIFNPLLILLMVPLFEGFIYKWARKVVKVTPLRKMALGGLLAAVSFVIAGFLQLQVNNTMEQKPPAGNVFVQRLGNLSQSITFTPTNGEPGVQVQDARTAVPVGLYTAKVGGSTFNFNFSVPEKISSQAGMVYVTAFYNTPKGTTMSYFNCTTEKAEGTKVMVAVSPDSPLFAGSLYAIDNNGKVATHTAIKTGESLTITPPFFSSEQYILKWGANENCSVDWTVCDFELPFVAKMGAAHILDLGDGNSRPELTRLVRENSVSILWMLPQYFVITLGEVLLSVTGLEFSYSQSAPCMKSVLQAIWLLTVFLGNVIDMAISGSHIVPDPATEFFVYALLMALVIGVFIILAMRYTYVEDRQPLESEEKPPQAVESLGGKAALDDTSF